MKAENLTRLETRLDRLWREWLVARAKAQASQDITDGVAAGRAWARWLAEFERSAQGDAA
ncbi:hypothetical protein [Nitrobacter sp.]|uniref:hypothetical protein n=1 Tax=Nitrobacter sp. TaxID=29420 RepID=UPI001D38B4C4|nr:hypothetical protein [Nitrobacter sp.]MCB1393835.1 hypothetical protein [Nitrobacter sp.]